jgi:lipopolysaccharide/colanic/teichoic acid biosynthesis glycosyltransferase
MGNTPYVKYGKRWLDVFFTLLLLVGTSWLFLLILLFYVVTFQFPIFFFQERVGKDGNPFRIGKFRTLKDIPSSGLKKQFLLGNLLRFFSLDELPQLWNVLKGEMSLIGPRPLPIEYLPLYSVEQLKRHHVRPGITGMAQVSGRHSISWQQKFKLDIEYVQHISFALDVQLFFRTIVLLLSFRKDNSLEEEKFKGN